MCVFLLCDTLTLIVYEICGQSLQKGHAQSSKERLHCYTQLVYSACQTVRLLMVRF